MRWRMGATGRLLRSGHASLLAFIVARQLVAAIAAGMATKMAVLLIDHVLLTDSGPMNLRTWS